MARGGAGWRIRPADAGRQSWRYGAARGLVRCQTRCIMILEHGDWELREGSCLDPVTGLASLADGVAHVMLSDPPYEAEAHTLQRRVKRGGGVEIEPVGFSQIGETERLMVSAEAARSCAHRALVFCQAEAVTAWRGAFDATPMLYRRAIPWIKRDAMPSLHGRWPGQSYESIVLAQHPDSLACPVGGKAVSYDITKGSDKNGGNEHPTQKPLALMEALVRDFTDPGDLVLDPFAGSGTTGVACRRLGRRFLGWELDPKHAATARKRIGAAREQGDLFTAPTKRQKEQQGDMFKVRP